MALTFMGGDFTGATTITGTVGSVGGSGSTVVVVSIYPKTATVSTVTGGWTLGKRINNSAGDGAQLVYYKNGSNSASVVFTMSGSVAGSWVTLSDTARAVKTDSFTENQGTWGTWASTKALSTIATVSGAAAIATYSPSFNPRKVAFPGNTLIVNQGVASTGRPGVSVGSRDLASGGTSGDITIYPYEFSELSPPTAPTGTGDEQWQSVAFILQAGSLPVAVISGTAEVSIVPGVSLTLPTPSLASIENDNGAIIPVGGTTAEQTPLIRGNLTAALGSGDAVHVYRNNTAIGTATVSGLTYTYVDLVTTAGSYVYKTRVEDGAEISEFSATYSITYRPPAERPSLTSGGGNPNIRRPGSMTW